MMDEQQRAKLLARWQELKNERSSWIPHWQDISRYLLPRSGRFLVTDRNRGERRDNKIYDSTGTRAARVLSAGLMAGMSSPARPWIRLTTTDPDLAKYQPVKIWLAEVTRVILDVFHRSNIYNTLHNVYTELGAFGTASTILQPSFQSVIHSHSLTVGEYAIATDGDGRVDTLYREFQMTVRNLVREFGYKNCSIATQNLYDKGTYNQLVTVLHTIEPRLDRDTRKHDAVNMPWRSAHYELGAPGTQCLRESGYRAFNVLAPRWNIISNGDIYGSSPGMEALGDIMGLQHEQYRKAQAIDYQTDPPLQMPAKLKDAGVDRLPGGVTYVDSVGAQNAIQTMFDVRLDLSHLLADIQDIRARINDAFYVNLFLMLANQTDSRMTATEVAERHEEKLLMLGPVLERSQSELFKPLIDQTFDRAVEVGLIPPPPQELHDQELSVEYISILAQAQRAIGTNSMDRFTMALGTVAAVKPSVLDKFDEDKWADAYADMLGVDPSVVVANDKVAIIRKQRADIAKAQHTAEMLQTGAGVARDLAAAKTGERNALTDVTRGLTGYT